MRLANLPTDLACVDGDVLVTHGTPRSPWESLLLSWNGEDFRPRRDEHVLARLEGWGEPSLVVVGHMHHAYTRRIGQTLCVNVGPGSSPNDGDPRACWGMARRDRSGWRFEHHRVPYDWDAAADWTARYGVHREEGAPHVTPVRRPLLESS